MIGVLAFVPSMALDVHWGWIVALKTLIVLQIIPIGDEPVEGSPPG